MTLDLILEGHQSQRQHRPMLNGLLENASGTVRIVSAYVTDTELLSRIKNPDMRLLTYISEMDIIAGSTSINALRELIRSGVQCRYVSTGPRLHAKVYIFHDHSAVVTSANLTRKALDENIEVGVRLSSSEVQKLTLWFDTLWRNRADQLDLGTLARWERETKEQRAEYLAVRQKAKKLSMTSPSETWSYGDSVEAISELFNTAAHFFVCNTNRRYP